MEEKISCAPISSERTLAWTEKKSSVVVEGSNPEFGRKFALAKAVVCSLDERGLICFVYLCVAYVPQPQNAIVNIFNILRLKIVPNESGKQQF